MVSGRSIELQDLINRVKGDDTFERLLVVLMAKEQLGWKWKLPQYLIEATEYYPLIEAAERWLSVNDNISLMRPYIKRYVYGIDGGLSIKTKGPDWSCVPLSITYIDDVPTLNPHTTDVYEWLNDNVYTHSKTLPVLDVKDCINYGTPNRGK